MNDWEQHNLKKWKCTLWDLYVRNIWKSSEDSVCFTTEIVSNKKVVLADYFRIHSAISARMPLKRRLHPKSVCHPMVLFMCRYMKCCMILTRGWSLWMSASLLKFLLRYFQLLTNHIKADSTTSGHTGAVLKSPSLWVPISALSNSKRYFYNTNKHIHTISRKLFGWRCRESGMLSIRHLLAILPIAYPVLAHPTHPGFTSTTLSLTYTM